MAQILPQTPYETHTPKLSQWEKLLWRWLRALRDDVLHELQARIMDELAHRAGGK